MPDKEVVAISGDEEVRDEVSDGIATAMDVQDATLLFEAEDFNPEFFIRAVGTALDEDDILNASVQYRFDQQQEPKKGRRQAKKAKKAQMGTTMQASAMMNPRKAFVAKCEAQITDFSMKFIEDDGTKGGKVVVRRYDKGSSVADRDNRACYVSWVMSETMRELVEGFLDRLAGRGTDAQEDFEDLLFEQPQLLKTS